MPLVEPTAATNERNHYNHPTPARVPIRVDAHSVDHDPLPLRWQELLAWARFDYVGNTSGPRAPQFPQQQQQHRQQKKGAAPHRRWCGRRREEEREQSGDVAIGKLPAAKRGFRQESGGAAHFCHSLEGFICVLGEQYLLCSISMRFIRSMPIFRNSMWTILFGNLRIEIKVLRRPCSPFVKLLRTLSFKG